jgi:hypothetical protein
MNNLNKVQKTEKIINQIIQKSWSNSKFKKQLINDPLNTIEFHTGYKLVLNKNETLKIEDQTDSNIIFLNIPRSVQGSNFQENLELTDEQLESVSGGDFWATACIVLAVCYFLNDVVDGAGQYVDEHK